jgi:hypothetical protein
MPSLVLYMRTTCSWGEGAYVRAVQRRLLRDSEAHPVSTAHHNARAVDVDAAAEKCARFV